MAPGSLFFVTDSLASDINLHILAPHIGLLALEALLGKLFRFLSIFRVLALHAMELVRKVTP